VELTMEERVDSLEVTVRHLVNEWVPSLQVKVERLDTYAGPGQNEVFSENFVAIRQRLDRIGRIQDGHTRILAKHTKMLTGLTNSVKTLKGDVSTLKGDVSTLKGDMAEVKNDVATLKTELAEFKVEVNGALAEILNRLPAKGA
jgi:peptidoglycan hydrolase CwlO-like protein